MDRPSALAFATLAESNHLDTSSLPTTEHPEDKAYAMLRQKPGASTTRRVRIPKTCFGADLASSWWAAVLVACAPD
jgi:hypothetical protein